MSKPFFLPASKRRPFPPQNPDMINPVKDYPIN